MTRRVGSRQSAKERATTKPLVLAMNQRTFRFRQGKGRQTCYSGRTADVRMYDAMFAAGLRLPLTALHRQLADFLGLSVTQIAPNAWRTFIGAEILWGRLSGGNRQLTLDEFFYCYRPIILLRLRGHTILMPEIKI